MNAADEAALTSAMAMGDGSAFEELYSVYKEHVSKIVRAILRVKCVDPPDHAQDVEQDVWIKLLHRAGQYDSTRGKFVHWLNRLVRNASIDHINRCDTRTTTIEGTEGTGIFGELPAGGAEVGIVNRLLLGELWEKLNDRERTLAILLFVEGLDGREIAQTLDITEVAARVRIHRLVHKLEKIARSDTGRSGDE
jgi:RNA polymerase sigma-70 factor (ECF subfamily)